MYPLPTQLQSHIFWDTHWLTFSSFLMLTSKTFHGISFFFLSSNLLLFLITHHCNTVIYVYFSHVLFKWHCFFFFFCFSLLPYIHSASTLHNEKKNYDRKLSMPIFWIFYLCVFFFFILVVIKLSWYTRALWYHAQY